MNGDGHLDLAVANATSNSVTVLAGSGTGFFSAATGSPFAVGAGPQSVLEADFNADGRPDLATVNYTSLTVSELTNQACTMNVQPASLALDGAMADTSLSIIAANPSTCNWSALTSASWITLGTSTGINSGYETVSLTQNTTGAQRTGTIQIAGINVTVTQDATLQQFADVLPSEYYFDAVDLLKQSNVTDGCSSDDYCPTAPVTRAQMAVLIVRARYGSSAQVPYPPTPYFTDVPSNAFGFSFIQRMRQDNITSGCSPTTFCPADPVLRGDMAIFLERGMFNNQLPVGEAYIGSLSTRTLTVGSNADITVTGISTNFVQGTTVVNPIPGIEVNSVTVTSPTSLTVNVTAGSMPTNQPEAFWVTTGSEDAVLPAAFSVQ